MAKNPSLNLIQRKVTYTLVKDDKVFIVENVPARVDVETGEQFFSPGTVDRLQSIIEDSPKPHRVVQTPVFNFV